ncbi:restriction endonuclease subunit S [Malikia sp.]|uniref:restriction endonuclease subunit S n=1 Tax=Malikia sp. TaxID=2070706 RepID=UPI00262D5D9E|nr:restriction endonuclease subunit S [Malikia sp.]MDD2727654.1 restriction endonuclease subunit S [Malikia sp.]
MTGNWTTASIADIAQKVGSGATPLGGEAAYKSTGTPLIRSMNVVFFGFKRDGLAFIDGQQASALDGATVRAQDVLLNITGASIGRVTLAPSDMDGARVNQHVCIIRPNSCIDSRYLNAYLSSPAVQSKIWADNTGTTRQALTKQQILGFEIPVAPLTEQKRIADKLDTVLTRVDAVNSRLARVVLLLKRFRQSVLTAATSGRLTEDWRGSGLAEWQSKEIQEICHSISDGDHQAPPQVISGIPFITISALHGGHLDLHKATRYVPNSYFSALDEKRRPARGDVLFSVTGSIGIPALVATDEPFTFQRHIAILKPDLIKVSSSYLRYLLESNDVKRQAIAVATGTAQMTIPLGGLRRIKVNLPPLDEQAEIVRRVETLFAFVDRLEARLQTARTAANRLTPALLAKAFRGELVAQDPDDEPAAELLKRLAASQAGSGSGSTRSRKKSGTVRHTATGDLHA